MIIAGIDPGKTGELAILHPDGSEHLIPQQIAQKPSLFRKRRIAAHPKRVK